jgi:hypothetical protein
MTTATTPKQGTRGLWLIPTGLILLSLIPIVSGSLRLTQLSGGPELIPEAARFTGFPLPVILHIVAGILFSVVGAFQFLPGLRRGRRGWHRMAGRVRRDSSSRSPACGWPRSPRSLSETALRCASSAGSSGPT